MMEFYIEEKKYQEMKKQMNKKNDYFSKEEIEKCMDTLHIKLK